MGIGLVLEGGAMRGLYTMGVLDAMMDEGVHVDALVGVSAGALFGANLFSGQRSRALRYNKRFIGDKRYMSWHSLLTTGDFVNRDFAFYEITKVHDPFDEEAFERYGGEFYAAATNVLTGQAEYLRIDNVMEQMETLRATAALPFVSRMVEIDGKRYLDGGVADSIPVRACMEMGHDKVILVLTQPASYRKKPINPLAPKLFYGRYPRLKEALLTRHERYNAQCDDVAELEKAGRIFVIRPAAPLDVSRFEKDPQKLQAVYDTGLADGRREMERLRGYLLA